RTAILDGGLERTTSGLKGSLQPPLSFHRNRDVSVMGCSPDYAVRRRRSCHLRTLLRCGDRLPGTDENSRAVELVAVIAIVLESVLGIATIYACRHVGSWHRHLRGSG